MCGFSSKAFESPAANSVPAKIPMYCGPGARDSYIGEANMDFTNMLRDVWKFLISGTVLNTAPRSRSGLAP